MEKVTSLFEKMMTSQNQLMTNQSVQLNNIQNRIITLERNNGPRNFQHQHEPRIPNQLDSTNLVDEVIPLCRPCDQLHPEST